MGILDETSRVLEESADRINQVKAAAIARQVKYLEDNAGKDTDGHWLFWNDKENIFKISFDKFKELLKTEPINGQKLASIISMLNPLMKRLKNMPGAVKGGVGTLTFAQFKSICADDTELNELCSDFSTIFMTVNDFNSKADPAGYLFSTLTSALRCLQFRLAAVTGLDEGQICLRSNGVENEVELKLSVDAPIIHSMAKNLLGKDEYDEKIKSADENNVVDIITNTLIENVNNQVHAEDPNIQAALEFVGMADKLNLNQAALENYAAAKSIPDCSKMLLKDLQENIMVEIRKRFQPRVDSLYENFGAAGLAGKCGLPSDCNLSSACSTDVLRSCQLDLLVTCSETYEDLATNLQQVKVAYESAVQRIGELNQKLSEINTHMTNLKNQVGQLPVDLSDTINQLLTADFYGSKLESDIQTFSKNLTDAVESYYDCK